MSYIAYLDLLGTKGFCEDEEIYYQKIKKFSEAVEALSPIIGKTGKIGIFSDCVYIECSQIEKILQFLTDLRTILIGDDLFFNAALSSGELGVESITSSQIVKKDSEGVLSDTDQVKESNIFGVRFTNKEIATIYCKQTTFRGVGIWIEPDLVDTIKSTDYQVIKSLYYSKEKKNGNTVFVPKEYYDISLFSKTDLTDSFDVKRRQTILSIILKTLYASHCKSLNYSAYYISLLINIIRTCREETLQWKRNDNVFENGTVVFNIIYKFLCECDNDLGNLIGLDSLVLAFLNQVYDCKSILSYDKADITEFFIKKFQCLKKKYEYNLNSVPKEPFTDENRKMFINFCNDNMASKFVDNIMDDITS